MGEPLEQRLSELRARIDRMALEPDTVTAPWTVRLARPFYRMLGWQPELSVARTRALFGALSRRERDASLAEDAALALAVAELEDNVRVAERACVVNGRLPIAELAWLGRLTRVLTQAARTLSGELDAPAALAAAFDPVAIAPPLRVAGTPEPRTSRASWEVASRWEPGTARLLELQLAAIDHILEAARSEVAFLERRRRLFEAARRLLLDADAALALDPEGVRERKRYVAAQIVQIDRLEGRSLSPHVALLHQAKSAMARGEHGRLYAALCAMEAFATASGDVRGAGLARRALAALDADADTTSPAAQARSLRLSVVDVMGERVVTHVIGAYERSRAARGREDDADDDDIAELVRDYLVPGSETATLSALLSVDGCFDVGAPLAPIRVTERRVVARVVSHPTSELLLTRARGVEDIPAAILTDPRSVVLDLAAGRLLARRFVSYEEQKRERVEMVGEVRVYLLDGSTSMLERPARARMRDAILTAELATLMRRFEVPERYTRVLMFYRYFTKRIWPLHRVDSSERALAAIGEVLERQWDGGTDIERALEASFEMIRAARARDDELARAQVVLITDGEAPVRERVVHDARERVGELPVAVSVIALGQENLALRALVARQRARGERAFYHHLDDETLEALASGDLASGRALHPPPKEVPWSRGELETRVGEVLEEAADLERERHRVLLSPPADLSAALAELGLAAESLTEGQRALHEASERDRRALESRYRRWFPSVDGRGEQGAVSVEDEEAVVLVLGTVAEVLSELGAEPLALKADAVDVLERLLPDARLSPAEYDAVMRSPSPAIVTALRAVHAITTSASGRS